MERPERGLACDGSTTGGNPGISNYMITDIKAREIINKGEPFYGTNNHAEFIALIVGIFYSLDRGEQVLYSDSITAMAWLRKGVIKTTMPRTERTEDAYKALARCSKYLESLQVEPSGGETNDIIVTNKDTGEYVVIRKWNSRAWGRTLRTLVINKNK